MSVYDHKVKRSSKHFAVVMHSITDFNPIQDGVFRGCSRIGQGWVGAKRPTLSKICHTYPTMMKLGAVIPYLKKIQKIYE